MLSKGKEYKFQFDLFKLIVCTLDQSGENPTEEEDHGNKDGKNQRKYQ